MESTTFVVQEHSQGSDTHWDLMLRQGDVLLTWRVPLPPLQIAAASQPIRVQRIFDHPLRFLDYEGPVQNDTGRVRIADRGTCDVLAATEREFDLQLRGDVFKGRFALKHKRKHDWLLSKG